MEGGGGGLTAMAMATATATATCENQIKQQHLGVANEVLLLQRSKVGKVWATTAHCDKNADRVNNVTPVVLGCVPANVWITRWEIAKR